MSDKPRLSDKQILDGLLDYMMELSKWVSYQQKEWQQDIAQECYLQCLAVECGEGECAEAIATKFPDLVTRLDDKNE